MESSIRNGHVSIYGLLAEFNGADHLLNACNVVRDEGYRDFDAFSPFPIDGLGEAMGIRPKSIQLWALVGGVVGGSLGFGLQYYVNVYAYPINVGGRPLNSIPSFIPATFELAVLFSALAAVFAMIIQNGLPKLFHSVFHIDAFSRASTDGFFVCIESQDPKFELDQTKAFLQSVGARRVYEIPI